jgi:hypothetical protein
MIFSLALPFERGVLLLPDVSFETLQALFNGSEVGENQLQFDALDIPPGVDGAAFRRQRVILERPHHVRQSVHIPQGAQLRAGPRQLNDAAGHVHVLDTGVDLLLGMEHLRQPVQPRVRKVNDSDVRLRPARAQARAVRVRQGAKQRRFPGLCETHDPDVQQFASRRGTGLRDKYDKVCCTTILAHERGRGRGAPASSPWLGWRETRQRQPPGRRHHLS